MAKVGAQRAADLTGKSKSTIQRAMNAGKLSYEMDANNRRIIDVSELERVFGLEPQGNASQSSGEAAVETELKKAADLIEMERMKMRIRALEDQLDMTQEQLEDIKSQRDQWQKQAQQILITSQYSQKQAEELKAELRERDERAKAQRQKMLEERMKRMKGQNENAGHGQQPVQQQQPHQPQQQQGQPLHRAATQQPPKQPATPPQNTAAGNNSGLDFQGLWKKIKGEKGEKAA